VIFTAVADTHAALWYLYADPRLSTRSTTFINKAIADGLSIGVSPISLVEVVYLVEKSRVPATAYDDLSAALADPMGVLKEAPLNAHVVRSMMLVLRQAVPDMPDRIIAATAIHLAVPLLSRDGAFASPPSKPSGN